MVKLQRRQAMAAAAAGLLVAALTACVGPEDDPNVIKVGASLPLTGEFSQPGEAARQGYEVWEEMVNESGGLLGKEVDLVVKDDGSTQNTVVSDYNALISRDRVDLLLGTFSSLLNLPASAVAERQGMLYVEPAGGSDEMFNRGYEYLFFAQQAVSPKQSDVFVDWIGSLPPDERPKTAAYPTLDDPFAAPVVDGAREQLEELGVETVYSETYAQDTKNFDSIASAIKSAAPDLLVHGAQFEDGVGLVRALMKADAAPSMLFQTNAPTFGSQYADGIGVDNTEGIFFAVSHSPQAQTPGNEEFVAKYKEMFDGAEPPEDAADAFAAGQVLQAAVEGVGSIDDQEALADWLRANSVETVLGDLAWDDTGAPTGEYLIGQWHDGKAEIVLPDEVSTGKITPEWKPADR